VAGPVPAWRTRLRRAAGLLRRMLERRDKIRLPVLADPDPTLLIAFPGEAELPPELRDAALLAGALAWRGRTGAPSEPGDRPPEATARRSADAGSIANVVFVSHCDFTGNSALHVLAIARGLYERGLSPVVAVPDNAESVEDVGRPPFPVITYRDARRALRFPDGRGPDLVHAFTPRELVRRLTADLVRAHRCPYVVHLEDNEEAILSAELGGMDVEGLRQLPAPLLDRAIGPRQFHPLRGARFLEHAAGVTVVVERLLELAPRHVPSTVVGACFDEAVLSPRRPRDEVRAELGLDAGDLAIVYTGNIHRTNLGDMRELYAAVAELRRDGLPIVLVKTGWNSPEAAQLPRLEEGLRDLGWVRRSAVPELLAAADVLVQPGGPGPFNDYRFPSKLPEFLASGRPVILPRTNLGLDLRDGEEALVLEGGNAEEIREAVARLAADPELRRRVGEGGRAFAVRELDWARSVDRVEKLYREIEAAGRPAVPPWVLDGVDPPVKLIAVVPEPPSEYEARAARAHGIWGFCFPASRLPAVPALDFPYCLDVRNGYSETALMALSEPAYVRVGGEPLVLASDLAVEPFPEPGRYGDRMRERLSVALPDRIWFRSVAFPENTADRSEYEAWLRKLVLQTALRAPAQEPILFVDPAPAWTQPARRRAWLGATQAGLRDGVRQLYACRRVDIRRRDVARTLRAT